MKIVNILFSDKNGGVEQSFVSYCRLLKELNHEVLAIVKKGAPYALELKKIGIEFIEIENKFGYYDFFAISKIKKAINNFGANLVFAHVGRAVVLARKALKSFPKIPLIAVNHSNNVKRSVGSNIVLSVNREIFYKTIDKGQPAERSFVMPNFIDISESKKEFNLEKYSFSKDKEIVIGAIGRLSKEKGFENLIRALEVLKNDKYKIKLKIAGDGEEKINLNMLVNSLALQDEVEFLGWTDDKEKFFSAIDIFCLPSHEESFGLVILEAMNFMKPIIATNTDGARSIIKHNVNGILVERENSKSLPNNIAVSISQMINKPDLIFDLVTNAKKDLDGNYSLNAAKERIKDIIDLATKS